MERTLSVLLELFLVQAALKTWSQLLVLHQRMIVFSVRKDEWDKTISLNKQKNIFIFLLKYRAQFNPDKQLTVGPIKRRLKLLLGS